MTHALSLARLGVLAWCAAAAAQAELPRAAVDELVARLADERTAAAAISELVGHGKAAVPGLTARLAAAGADKAAWVTPCIRVLGRIGPDAAASLDVLVELANGSRHTHEAFVAIGCIAPFVERRGEVEATLLARAVPGGGGINLPTFARLGFDATVPTPQLLDGLVDSNPFVRQLVCEALVLRHRRHDLSGPDRARSCAALREALVAEHPTQARMRIGRLGCVMHVERRTVVRSVSVALATLAPELVESVDGHRALLGDLDVNVQAKAARDLGLLGPHAAPATADLTTALAGDVKVAREAATALGIIGVGDAAVLAALVEASKSGDVQLAARAAASLRQLGRHGR